MASILFVAYHFAPESASGTHRSLHFARALVDAGHSVSVVTGPEPPAERSDPGLSQIFPWPERVLRVSAPRSVGSLYAGWKHRRMSVAAARAGDGTASVQVPPPRSTALRRLVARARFHAGVWEALPDHHRAWSRPATRAGVAFGRRVGAAAVFASGPPWTGVRVGHAVAQRLGIPFVADFRDPWNGNTGATWCYATEWAQRRAGRWEAAILADADRVCFNSPRLATAAMAHGAVEAKARTIVNGSNVPRNTQAVAVSNERPLRFRHLGSLYAGRSIWPLVATLDELIGAGALAREEAEVELIGDIEMSSSVRTRMAAAKVPIRLTPHVKFADAVSLMSDPCVLLSIQSEQHAKLIPTKLFDYLCTGNPVLVLSPHASASWDVARGFARCHRLDLQPSEHNRVVLGQLLAAWRRGALYRECSVEDTAVFGKDTIGTEFVRIMEDVVARHNDDSRHSAERPQ